MTRDSEGNKITIIPYYGGGKGQSLQIIEGPDGITTTTIIKSPENITTKPQEVVDVTELENPQLPSVYEKQFSSNLRNIHKIAIDIINLQESAKERGKLTEQEKNEYEEKMVELNVLARTLAEVQDVSDETDLVLENREGLESWFDKKKTNKKDKNKKKDEEEKKKKEEEKRKKEEEAKRKQEEEEEKRRKEEEEKKKKEEEKNKEGEEENEEEEGDEDDTISVGTPDDSSVAEAKPIGLAIAGVGGVAASKPIATAVVGPGGLAIARPVGTAIAGVSPEQALVPSYAESYIGVDKPLKNGVMRKSQSTSEYISKLIGKYHQV